MPWLGCFLFPFLVLFPVVVFVASASVEESTKQICGVVQVEHIRPD